MQSRQARPHQVGEPCEQAQIGLDHRRDAGAAHLQHDRRGILQLAEPMPVTLAAHATWGSASRAIPTGACRPAMRRPATPFGR